MTVISRPVDARDRGFTNYDGDTFRATFRIANIDTPEIKGKCDAERALALKAKIFTQVFLKRGNVVIRQTGTVRYGRILAVVSVAADDLGKALIAAGLARPWKGRREKWC
jgi:endonuclease YncB( thermonuclease family)